MNPELHLLRSSGFMPCFSIVLDYNGPLKACRKFILLRITNSVLESSTSCDEISWQGRFVSWQAPRCWTIQTNKKKGWDCYLKLLSTPLSIPKQVWSNQNTIKTLLQYLVFQPAIRAANQNSVLPAHMFDLSYEKSYDYHIRQSEE